MGAIDPQGGAIFDPRGMIGRIYKKLLITMLHTKYTNFGSCGFFMYCPIIRLWQIMTSPWQGLYRPKGHSWQDLQRGPLYIATHKI